MKKGIRFYKSVVKSYWFYTIGYCLIFLLFSYLNIPFEFRYLFKIENIDLFELCLFFGINGLYIFITQKMINFCLKSDFTILFSFIFMLPLVRSYILLIIFVIQKII